MSNPNGVPPPSATKRTLSSLRSQPEAVGQVAFANGCFWPTDDGPHPLTACPKPDAQGAARKVSFAVLRSQVARPGVGQELSFGR